MAALQGAEVILHPTNCGAITGRPRDRNITIRARDGMGASALSSCVAAGPGALAVPAYRNRIE